MPYVNPRQFSKILNYIDPGTRKKSYAGGFTWLHLYTVAYNLASCVAAIHERGYCIGDINESNILVDATAPLTIIDCDSFQVKDTYTGQIWRCKYGKPEYTAPELMGYKYEDVDRTLQTDNFALAIMIFQLLMEGYHPYAARGSLVANASNTRDKIKLGIFPYDNGKKGVEPPEDVPSFTILPPTIQTFFVRCFDSGHKNPSLRPSAKEWMQELHNSMKDFIQCISNENHRYLKHLKSCPWCDRSHSIGNEKDSFPSSAGIQIKLQNPNNQTVSMQDREDHLTRIIQLALMDGYLSPEEEAFIIDEGIKIHLSEKDAKRLIAIEVKKKGSSSGTSGSPSVRVDRTYIAHQDVDNGTTLQETIEVSNVGTGVLTGTIVSNVLWIKVPTSIAPNMQNQSQKLQLIIDTKSLPYGFSGTGTVSIRSNGGDISISISLATKGLSELTERFRKSYVPLIAACAGLIGSFSNSPISNFLVGAFFAGIIAFAFAKLFVKFFLNKGINIFKMHPVLIQGAAAGIVILTIMAHSGGGSSVGNQSPSAPASAPASVPSSAPASPSINITKAVVAADADANNVAIGIDTSFLPGNKTLHYNITYDGAIANQTVFFFKWFKSGNLISESQFTLQYPSGWVDSKLNYDFQPGQYEVQLHVNGRQLNSTSFLINANNTEIQPLKPIFDQTGNNISQHNKDEVISNKEIGNSEKEIKAESEAKQTQDIPEVSNEFVMPVYNIPPNATKLVLINAVITLPNGESKPANVNYYEVRQGNVLFVRTTDYYPKASQLHCNYNFEIRQYPVALPSFPRPYIPRPGFR
jgi:serine/threonine protein kinase